MSKIVCWYGHMMKVDGGHVFGITFDLEVKVKRRRRSE